MDQLALLRSVPLFSGLQDREVQALSDAAHFHRYPKNSMIVLAQEEGNTLFIIGKGRVKVSIQSEDGREVVLSILGASEFFGEMSLLDGKPRSATVVALEDTEALVLRRVDLLRLIERFPQLAIQFLSELTARLRKTDRKIESLALMDVPGRIVCTLLQLAEDEGIQGLKGTLIRNRPTHQMLANMSGTTRETVTRMLRRLENEGYIACTSRDVLIRRKEDLQRDFISS